MGSLSAVLRRQWLTLILASLCISLILNVLRGPAGALDLMGLARTRTRLIAENEQLKAANIHLEAQASRLRTDDAYIQRLIREELGYARPDEFVYRFRST